jgi:hypothetical protein
MTNIDEDQTKDEHPKVMTIDFFLKTRLHST